MHIEYTTEVFTSLVQLVNYIESKNTRGAGLRWLNRFETFLQKKLHKPEKSSSVIMQLLANLIFAVFTLTTGLLPFQ